MQYRARRGAMIGEEVKTTGIARVHRRVVLVSLVGVLCEGVAVLAILMAMARSVFVVEWFMVLVAEESGTMKFWLLRSRL